MGLPSKKEIEKRAKGLDIMRALKVGLPAITPERHELSESGTIREAQHDLMRTRAKARSQQAKYVHDVAEEVGLKVMERREFREHQKKVQAFDVFRKRYPTRVKKVNGYKISLPVIPTPKIMKTPKRVKVRKPPKPKPSFKTPSQITPKIVTVTKPKKKRRKSHVERTGKTMRSLAKIKGVNVFSFPDDMWKVKRKRRRK